MLCFTLFTSILCNFCSQLLYAEQIDIDSLMMENSNILETNKNQSSDNDGKFNFAVASDWGCSEDTEKTAENIQRIQNLSFLQETKVMMNLQIAGLK